jgi:hypothetical protein
MLQMASAGAIVAGLTMAGSAQTEQTWTGFISDSHCGAVHQSDIEHGGRITARECIIGREGDASIPGCVSAKNGAKFVFVDTNNRNKIYQVANQDFAGLRVHAAHDVQLTGRLSGDTITVTQIMMRQSQ